MKTRPFLRKTDLIIIFLIILLALAFLLIFSGGRKANSLNIKVDGETVYSENFSNIRKTFDYKISSDGGDAVLEISPDGVRFSENDCKNKLCVHAGKISRAGELLICLPKKIVVEISGDRVENLVTY